MDPGLFDLPDGAYVAPPPPEQLTRAQRRQRLVATRIAQGKHPLGYVPLHPQASRQRDGEGPTCGSCQFRTLIRHHDKTYPKCHLPTLIDGKTTHPRDTGCESSDIRAWWPACRDYQAKIIEDRETDHSG